MKNNNEIYLNLVSIVVLTISFIISIHILVDYVKLEKISVNFNRVASAKYFQVVDTYKGGELSSLFSEKGAFNRIRSFNHEIKRAAEFFEIDTQDMWISKDMDNSFKYSDEFRSDYESEYYGENDEIGVALKSVQIGRETYSFFDIGSEIIEGRGFSTEDFTYKSGEYIPIVLGNEYTGMCKVGDTSTLSYLNYKIKVEVIGFLKMDVHVTINEQVQFLDQKIIIPFFDVEQLAVDSKEEEFFNRLYIQKNWDFIKPKSDESIEHYVDLVSKLRQELNLNYVINGTVQKNEVNNINETIFSTKSFKTIFYSTVIIILMSLFCLTEIVGFNNHRTEYCINVFCGCSINKIKFKIILKAIIKGMISIIAAIIVYSFVVDLRVIVQILDKIFITYAVSQIVSVAIIYTYINKRELFDSFKQIE